MTAADDKASLRRQVLLRRAAVPGDGRRRLSETLAALGLELVRASSPARVPVVSGYQPIRDEADPSQLIEVLAAAGVTTALPVTVAPARPLRFLEWRPGEPLVLGGLGIREPAGTAPEVMPDVLFVPLAAFDRRGFRLGYGAGYYDSSLTELRRRKTVLAVGVAFATQEVDRVPTEPHDERLDAMVTERGLMRFGQG